MNARAANAAISPASVSVSRTGSEKPRRRRRAGLFDCWPSRRYGSVFGEASIRSPQNRRLREGPQEQRIDQVVVDVDGAERDDDGLVDRTSHACRAALRVHPLVTADERDDEAEAQDLQAVEGDLGEGEV